MDISMIISMSFVFILMCIAVYMAFKSIKDSQRRLREMRKELKGKEEK